MLVNQPWFHGLWYSAGLTSYSLLLDLMPNNRYVQGGTCGRGKAFVDSIVGISDDLLGCWTVTGGTDNRP